MRPPPARYQEVRQEQKDLVHLEVNKFAQTGPCQAAANMTQQIYAGPVFVHAHTWPEAEVTWNTSGGPPHTPVQQVIAAWLFEPQHINAGNLRRVLYHEAAHVLGYQHDHQISTDDFAEACMEAEDSPSSVSSFEENRPYVKGDLDGHMADDQSEPSWCLVRWWYIIETEQLVAVEILGCY